MSDDLPDDLLAHTEGVLDYNSYDIETGEVIRQLVSTIRAVHHLATELADPESDAASFGGDITDAAPLILSVLTEHGVSP